MQATGRRPRAARCLGLCTAAVLWLGALGCARTPEPPASSPPEAARATGVAPAPEALPLRPTEGSNPEPAHTAAALGPHAGRPVLAALAGRWRVADDGHGPAAWGVAGATVVRRGPDGVAREGWLEAPSPGLLRVRIEGLAHRELGLTFDGARAYLGPGRVGGRDALGLWVADNGLIRQDADGACRWFPRRAGGGTRAWFGAPVTIRCQLTDTEFVYHLPRRSRPGETEARHLRRVGAALLGPGVAPLEPGVAPLGPGGAPLEPGVAPLEPGVAPQVGGEAPAPP